MGRVICFLFAAFSLLHIRSNAQQDTVSERSPEIVTGDFSKFYVDNIGNIYALNQSADQINKFSKNGNIIGVFNDVRRFGSIHSLDVTNPLKTLVYYKNFNTVLFLDRLMNITGIIDLRKAGILQSSAVALSYDNLTWVYDSRDTKIKKVNEENKIVFESADLKSLFDEAPQPDAIFDRDGLLYLFDKKTGLMIFDYYGALKETHLFKDLTDIQISKNIITGRKGNKLFISGPGKFDERTIALPQNFKEATQTYFFAENFYTLHGGRIYIYPFTLP